MKLKEQIRSAAEICAVRALGVRIPVAVRINVTHRCLCRCRYCELWKTPVDELGTEDLLKTIRDFRRLGTTSLSISGGEPLLRSDIGRLVDEIARLGMDPSLNTSGYRMKERVDSLLNVGLVKISLDGPEAIHDHVRGRKGAFRTAIEAAEIASARLARMTFATTITRFNVDHLDYMLDLARGFGTVVAFQPLKALYMGAPDVSDLLPSRQSMQRAVAMLTGEKRRGHPGIRNSMVELRHLGHWPDYPPIRCAAGRSFAMLEPDGRLMPCDRIAYDAELPDIRRVGLGEALRRLPEVRCDGCAFCGSFVLNLLTSTWSWPVREVFRITR